MSWQQTSRVLVLLAGGLTACSGPTCESACQKTFTTCGLTALNPDSSIDEQIDACIASCTADLRNHSTEATAVGWVACVDEFECEPADEGIELCFTCQAGYYLGQSGGSACNAAPEASSFWLPPGKK